jgi:formiminotetrahydrofolate cyclodeaminase
MYIQIIALVGRMAHAIPASMVLRLSLGKSSGEDPTRASHGKYPKAIVVMDTSSELDKDLDKDSE